MDRIAGKLGEIAATEIVPVIIGLYLAYNLIKYIKKKRTKKPD